MWAMLAAPLFLGTDVSELDDETLEVVSNPQIIAIDQDTLGEQAKLVRTDNDVEIWVRQLEGGDYAVALLNGSETSHDILLSLNNLGIQGNYDVTDAWTSSELDEAVTSFSSSVDAYDTEVFRISKSMRIIVFDAQGDSTVESQHIVYGSVPSQPQPPVRDGYDFTGWTTDEAGVNAFDFQTPITADITLHAQWERKPASETALSDVSVSDVSDSSAVVSATLSVDGSPVSGATVEFHGGDSKLGEATTDGSGVASATLSGLDAATEYVIMAKYAGDETHQASVSANPVTFTTEDAPVEPVEGAPDSLVARRGNRFYFKYSLSGGDADTVVAYGKPGDQVLVGDWDGDGVDTLAVRRGNRFYIKNSLEGGDADTVVAYGRPGDQVLVGDWDGDGKDTLAVRRGKTYHFRDSLSGGAADTVVAYGRSSDQVLAGDWDGDGVDTLAVRRGKTYHFKNSLSGGQADTVIAYGKAYDQVLAGDWDSDGEDTLAVRRGKTYHFKDSLSGGQADKVIAYSGPYDQVFAGKWR